MANHALDLAGQKFGRLSVVRVAHKVGGVHWHCTCDCGNVKVARGADIKRGKVKSCGCLKSEFCSVVGASRALDLTGVRFGKLVAVKPTGLRRDRSIEWECACDCGAVSKVAAAKLRDGATKSCGCLRTETHTTHGMSKSPEFAVWYAMKERCSNQLNNRWATHGARGIRVCDRWVNSFENFYSDMGPRPESNLSLERVDNDGDYTPENCVWATDREQAENRRTTIRIEIDGRSQSLKAWCRELSVPYLRTWKRIYRSGWTLERALQP